ncbi:hypothetical protein SEA_NATHANVAAG_49 [Arthrobacter phage NathanVaag]|nr:hypothetical protein SEA_NATHANVAAG_49 [Arthrobacter phage NathanVaag]
MKIASDTTKTITRHHRSIKIEDGPIIPLDSTYIEGTAIKVDEITCSTTGDLMPVAFTMHGQLVNMGVPREGVASRYKRSFSITRIIPEVEFVLDLLDIEV